MKIKLRGKTWKQITKGDYLTLINDPETNHKVAFFKDIYYGEITYFEECVIERRDE